MLVLVGDASVVIDLDKVRLLEPVLSLPFEFVIPDVILAGELLSFEDPYRTRLRDLGLRLGELDAQGVRTANDFQRTDLTENCASRCATIARISSRLRV